MTRALICGSFDPVTLGHTDIIGRCAKIFDEVIVCIFVNSIKKPLFTNRQRLEMLNLVCSKYKNVRSDMSEMMAAEYVRSNDVQTIVKGIRNMTDYDYETMVSSVNLTLNPDAETMFLPADGRYRHICSTTVREMIKYGINLSGWVPDEVVQYMNSISTDGQADFKR